MESDDKVKWLEVRISSSLRPRNEDLKNMLLNDENRLAFHEFLNNEDIRRLFVYLRPPRHIIASLQPPHDLSYKSVFFLKANPGVKLNKENMNEEVMYFDSSEDILKQLDLMSREVYLPLLCSDTQHATNYGISADKLMDVLHRMMAIVEITKGYAEGEITLSLPSIEVLADAAASVNRRGAVLHVLETTVIGWIKQIKSILKHHPIEELYRHAGPYPGPLDEENLWSKRLDSLHSINAQLDSAVAQDILRNLEEANSTYASSFQIVRKDINKAIQDTNENLRFLSTMSPWFHRLHHCVDPKDMVKLFAPLIHTMLLVWTHSKYYHQVDKYQNLLRLISNEVVHRAEAMVGEDVLREPLDSYTKLKEALRVCAAFRGTYLDYRDKALEINEKNKQEHAEKLITRPQGPYTLFSTKMYGPNAYTPRYGTQNCTADEEEQMREEELWKDSPWPPRNAPSFDLLNSFMERCNDVLELVQTTRHFRLLADTAEIGGAGTQSLDALVREIHQQYTEAMNEFFSQVSNVLAIDGTQTFEKAFFIFRTVVKDLERKLAEVLRQSFYQCPTIGSQLRLLEVFEGISSRELVQQHLKDKDRQLVTAFTEELLQVSGLFKANEKHPPEHKNMPLVVSKMLWVYSLRRRIEMPMNKFKVVSPHSLEGDLGWHLRDAYSETIRDLKQYEAKVLTEWQNNITAELTERLKEPLMIAEEYDEEVEVRPQMVHVNLDPRLLLLLREIHYLSQEPFNAHLPAPARELLRNTNSASLRMLATRLETIVSKYNTVMHVMTEFEQPLFERCLAKIDDLFQLGLNQYTWRTEESADFIETANALVCADLHHNLDIVQTNCAEVVQITQAWSQGTLDIFAAREKDQSYHIKELVQMQKKLNEEVESSIVPGGNRVHSLLELSFQVVHISEASPAWQDYVDYIDAIVLEGLKQACLVSLKSMLNQIVQCNMSEGEDVPVPILTIRLELIENEVAFRPPLDTSTSYTSVHEIVEEWLEAFLDRGKLVPMLSNKGSYRDYIGIDEETTHLVDHIKRLVENNSEECKELYGLFKDYAFLWQQDVNQTFEEFLNGNVSPTLGETPGPISPSNLRAMASARSVTSRVSSAKSSIESAGLVGTAERSFLTPKTSRDMERNVPTLDEFDAEIDIYRSARDDIQALQDYQDIGWLRVDLQPIKQVLTTFASKWMWTYTKYLSDQVTYMLQKLDEFLKRTEPEIESITGEERDTASFMKMMRLFNEVSAQQQEMDGKFAAMHRTVLLVKKYDQKLPKSTQDLFDGAPARWNSLKTKVSLAKQRLGPRIQEESDRITKDLATFSERVETLQRELDASNVYSRDCSIGDAWVMIDSFVRRLEVLENEAQDLIELQELLEASVVNFAILPSCRHELNNLKQVWETVRIIDDQHSEWKRHRWQKMNTKFLREETNKQLDIIKALPEDVYTWDVYMGLHEYITTIQECLPLIDDLSNPAMRTRHWKQLVRVTGGAVQVDNDTLKRMTLGELLSLGLQKHVDDVRAIVQRAVKDLIIEKSLKTYEEVWLSKIFELREHVRNKMLATADKTTAGETSGDTQSEVSESASHQQGTVASRSQNRTTSRVSNQSSQSRTRRTSVSSLPQSLVLVGEEPGNILLLTNTSSIFEELENHQVALQAMQSSSAAGSFLDEVIKWQKRLQTIEAVLIHWLEVQEKWVELEEVYSTQEIRTALSHDGNTFALVSRDFKMLMKATEKNPNVLQCCQRKNILTILEKMSWNLDICRKSLLVHLEKRRGKFPRFYFLSTEDVLHIICNGYDLSQVNLYINKLFENIGKLTHEEIEEPDRFQFQVTGVCSVLGEKLTFTDPVPCEGLIEAWLPNLLTMIKSSLQHQLAVIMGTEKPPPSPQRPSSRAVKSPQEDRKTPTRSSSKEKQPSRAGSHIGSSHSRQGDKTPRKQEIVPSSATGHSWILDNVAEIVYLSTQINLTNQTNQALKEMDEGEKDSVQKAVDKLNKTIKATVVMLKGIEDEKDAEHRKIRHISEEEPEKDDVLSEIQSVGAQPHTVSQLGSTHDVNTLQLQQMSSMDDGKLQTDNGEEDQSAPGDPQTTTVPLDMLALQTRHPSSKPAEPESSIYETDRSELKLMLFPAQIRKISSLIALLAYQRELLSYMDRHYKEHGSALSEDFLWKSQLQYSFVEDTKQVPIKIMEHEFNYEFEYLGSAYREVITPLSEKIYLSLTQAVKYHLGGLLVSATGDGGLATLQELSKCLGKPLYLFNCTQKMESNLLYDIFKGYAATGSWIVFNNVNYVPPPVLSIISQLLKAVRDAIHNGKSQVHILNEDITLNTNVACFATLDAAIKVEASNPEKLFLFNSAVSKLPKEFTAQFRTISLVKPDLQLMVEVLLLSQGFINASELAHKMIILYDMCRQMIGTNTRLVSETSHLTYNSMDLANGWSKQSLRYISLESGAILDNMLHSKTRTPSVSGIRGADYFPGEEEKQDRETPEKGSVISRNDDISADESEAVVTALRNTFMPRLKDRDASIFTQLIKDLWPEVNIPLSFVGQMSGRSSQSDIDDMSVSQTGSKAGSRRKSHIPVVMTRHKSYRDSLRLNTPVVQLASAMDNNVIKGVSDDKLALRDIDDAIAVATADLGLLPGIAFQGRVSQLSQLNIVHKTIIVCGPAGCGKSECIKTFALAERERGKTVDIQSVYTKTYESHQLLGYQDHTTKAWKDGLIPSLLRNFCLGDNKSSYSVSDKPVMKVMQLDGEFDPQQFELVESMLTEDGCVIMANKEKLVLPDTLRFIWEIETLANLSPTILGNVGILSMTKDDVGWPMLVAVWLEKHSQSDRELLKTLCDQYLATVLEYLGEVTKPPVFGKAETSGVYMKRMIYQSEEAMIGTFTTILDALMTLFPNMTDIEIERMFNYAAVWAFGGTIDVDHRDIFSQWWKETFEKYIDYPDDGTVFDYVVDNESHTFVKWTDIIPAYTGSPHKGLPPDAYVHVPSNEQLLHLVGLLTDYGKPVMLVGEDGCGKSAIVSERVRTVCSGEVAEVLGLTMQANRFTNAGLLYKRLDELLEWKHGKTYVPKGNKRLLCFIDDINLAQTDKFHNQTATELIRQHIDDGGFYNPDDHSWRYVKNVTYISTANPHPTASVPKLNARLLRHFAVFGCPYPSHSEQHTIFSTLLHTHFITPELSVVDRNPVHHLGIQDDKVQVEIREEEAALKSLLSLIVEVTLELQEKLRLMFLPTAERCHYIFTMRDISNIFRNLCLSLEPACNRDNVLLLWEHECYWMYGHRMINEVDYERFRQAFIRLIRKDFPSEDQINLLSSRVKPIFSNLIEQDSGMVTAGNILPNQGNNSMEEKTDLYKPVYNVTEVKTLMEHGVEEYNKTHPRIKLALYRTVIEQVCRLARVISSPHEVAHCVLVSEGCPARTPVIVNLAAHLCGFNVFKINSSPRSSTTECMLDIFKADIVTAYTRAGVSGEKVLFLLEDDELSEEDFLVFLSEFIVSGSISHLFSQEEQTTIINSIRTEVTQAGLSYTRDVAWDFFLRTVKKNFRICFICSEVDANFQRRCREYPSFTKNVNFLWFGHWTKRELIHHAAFHLRGIKWMSRVQKENVAHMLATMHLVIRQQDGNERGSGQYRHLTNLTYEKFVERFISMACKRHEEIQDTHQTMVKMMAQIQRENALASKLKRELEHEKVVLRERKEGTIKILAQIGQDTAITEQQIKIVKAQMDKIHRLKKLLPEYQVAHERAVYKTVSIVADTKKIVQNINLDSLSELRAMQKPIIDIEDLMAAIIMILKKNPQADLTWQKGAKRQMANLERFIEELLTFDEEVLPESTLVLVEPYLKKPTFDPDSLERKTNNSACASLCRWVRGVCRYHRMMISKVKPLHSKVEETTAAIDNAEHRMHILDNKRKALEVRLADLAKGFEEATIDKNEQEEKTNKMDKKLETAARLKKVLQREQSRIQQVIDSFPHRQLSIFGGVAMAAGLATYLGPYHYHMRRIMLTIHWPNCLRERGIPLVIDSIDELKGRVVDWTIDELNTADGASGIGLSLGSLQEGLTPDGTKQKDELMAIQEEEEEAQNENEDKDENGEEEEEDEKQESTDKQNDTEEKKDEDSEKSPDNVKDNEEEDQHEYIEDEEAELDYNQRSMDGDQYNVYVKSLVKLLVGEDVLQDWLRKDFGSRQMENAAILYSSWQRPPMLIDPYGEGVSFLQWLNKKLNRKHLIVLDMDARCDPQVIMAIEKAITKGLPLLLENCSQTIDSLVTPIIQHRNTALETIEDEEPRMIKYCGRRILCYPDFRLYLAISHPKPKFTPSVASSTTLINFGSSNDTIVEELLMRAFAKVCPELYKERRLALKNIHVNSEALKHLWQHFKKQIYHAVGVEHMLFNEKDVDAVSDMTQKTILISQQLEDSRQVLNELDGLKNVLEPLARRAMKLYAIVRSLSSIQREYQFTLTYFIKLFDEAIQGEFPPEYTNDSDDDEGFPDDDTATVVGEKRPASVASVANDSQTDAKDDQTDKVDKDITSHQGSTIDGAPGTEVKEEDGKIELFELPEVVQLPTEGIEYASLPGNVIKQMIDNLTSMVFQHTQKSLYVEDRLLFAAMLCLTIQAEGDHFTEEEMSLLLQGNPGLGMQLSLADFDYKGEPPAWLPKDKWEDILAISVLPGPLDSLCVHMAKESDAWKMWYMSDKPEIEPLPLSGENKQATPVDDENKQNRNMTPDLGPLTEFHLLLLLRLLRPDRLPTAMSTYVSKHLNLNLNSQSEFGIEQLLNSVASQHIGVMVLLPASPSQTDSHAISSINMTFNPTECIKELAETTSVSIQVVTVGEGLDTVIFEAMETAEYNNSWLVVENLHHASDKFFKSLRDLLQRIARRREPKNAKFCVWFTTEPCPRIPMDLLLLLHKLAWDVLDTMAKEASSKSDVEAEHQIGDHLALESGLLENLLTKAVVSTFKSVPTETWETVSDLPQNIKCMIYAFGVVQGLFIARQMFGARGLSQFYQFGGSLYVQAIENVVDLGLAAEKNKWSIDDLIDLFSRMIYGQAVCNPWDKDYVITAAHYIISSIIHCQSETVRIGNVDFPVPPANVDPSEYSSWFADKISNTLSTIGGLNLHGNVDREANDAHAVQFIAMMDQLYEAQNLTLGDVQPVLVKQSMNMLRLRAILDNIVEALPPLLELGTIPEDLIKAEYDFPYHQPSVISLATTESVLMPESLGFVLLQECLWHNSLLCHIHQNVHEIHRRLLSGPQSFPRELIDTANSIMEEYVPTSWVHPNCQPCTHSITSWLADLNKRHIQMQSWVKHRMVPVFKEGSHTPESHGILRSVWLGGLVNPQALMVALRQEKAVMAGCRYDEVDLVVEVCELPPDAYDSDQVGGLYLTDLYMQGAMWDLDANQLTESSHDLNSLPGMRVYPQLQSDIKKATRYHCPVFMNRARQVCPFHLDLECSEPVTSWTLSGTAIILDIGIPADSSKKSRAFMMPKQTLSSARSDTSSQHEEMSQQGEEEEEYDFGDDPEVDNHSRQPTDRSEESVQTKSQLSYKPMSPQAPPLPPELQLTREPPMIDEQESKHTSPQTKQSSQGASPDKGSSQSGYSQPITGDGMKKTPSNQSISRMSDRSKKSSVLPKDAVPLGSETDSQQVHSQPPSNRSAASGRSSRHSPQATTMLDKDPGQGHVSDNSKTSARRGSSSTVQGAGLSQTSDKRQVLERDSGSVSKRSGMQKLSNDEQLDQAKSSFGSKPSFDRKSEHSQQDSNAGHSEKLLPSEHAETGSKSSARYNDSLAAGPSPHAPSQKSMSQAPSNKGSRQSLKSSDVKPENGGEQSSYLQDEVTSTNKSREESPHQP